MRIQGRMNPEILAETQVEACGSCRYWKKSENQAMGECHRHAPQAIAFNVEQKLQFQSRFPDTTAEDWCGDYQRE